MLSYLVEVLKIMLNIFVEFFKDGIKLEPSKCRFVKRQVKFMGRIVSEKGYCMDPDNIKAVTSLAEKTPSTVGDVRKLVGLLSYCHRLIPKFSVIAKPLYDLLTSPTRPASNPSCKPTGKKKVLGQLNSSSKVTWKKEHQAAVEELLHYLTTPPLLAYPDPNLPYILHTDACQDVLGVVLYQKQNDQLCVIAYASRTVTFAEQNYYMHSGKLEFLALKWAISDHFRDYLYYSPPFVAYTDNNPLTYVSTLTTLNATGHRCVGQLADFKFSIRYHPGKAHADADGLLRMPLDMKAYMASCTEEVSAEAISAVITASTHQVCQETAWVTSPDNALNDNNHVPDQLTPAKAEQFELLDAQLEDRDIEPIVSNMKKSVKPTREDLSHASSAMKLLSYE